MSRPVHPLPPADPALRAPARGTPARLAGRYESLQREWAHDGWDIPEETRTIAREVSVERPKSVITRNASPDLDFDRALNPYRGCEHGCIFCYARPSHAWLGLSPGLDFETRLIARPDAPEVLTRELGARGYQVAPLALGSNTDPWQPIESEHGITRAVLQVLHDWRHPVTITTRSALILRDLDILAEMAALGLVRVAVSLPSLDGDFLRASEPRAPRPETRLRVMSELAAAGVPVRLMLAPVIPGLSDDQVERVITAAAQAGAQAVWHSIVRLPHEVAPLFWDWLERVYPNRVARVRRALAEMRDGGENDSRFGSRFDGEGPMAKLLARRVDIAARRAGLARDLPALRCDLFRSPPRAGDQLDLFG